MRGRVQSRLVPSQPIILRTGFMQWAWCRRTSPIRSGPSGSDFRRAIGPSSRKCFCTAVGRTSSPWTTLDLRRQRRGENGAGALSDSLPARRHWSERLARDDQRGVDGGGGGCVRRDRRRYPQPTRQQATVEYPPLPGGREFSLPRRRRARRRGPRQVLGRLTVVSIRHLVGSLAKTTTLCRTAQELSR